MLRRITTRWRWRGITEVTIDRCNFARAAFFALLPAVSVGGAMGLPLLMGLAAMAAIDPTAMKEAITRRPAGLVLLIAFIVWASLSSIWSPADKPTALKISALLVFGLVFVGALSANASAVRLALSAALAAFLMLALGLGIEALFDLALNRAAMPGVAFGEVNRNPSRGLVVLLALTWPSVAWLIALGGQIRLVASWLIAVGAGVLSLQFGQNSTAAGFVAGLTAFGAAFLWPTLVIRATSLALAAWLLAAPFLTPLLVSSSALVEAVPLSWAARIAIWRYTCARILEQPWIGHGIDAGRATTDMISIRGLEMRGIPVHPHSASLQVWFDLGAVGAALAAAAIVLGGWRLGRSFAHDRPTAAAAAAVLAMFGFMANIGWSIWQEWWMATLLLAAALVAALGARGARA